MKKTKKIVLSLCAMLMLVMMFTMSAAASWSSVKVAEGSSATAIFVQWSKPVNTDSSYQVTGYYLENRNGDVVARIYNPNQTSYKFTGLTPGVVDTVYVYATYNYRYGSGKTYLGYTKVNTLPQKVTKLNISALEYHYTVNTATPAGADGVQIQAVDYRTKKTAKVVTGRSTINFDLMRNVPYAIRARAYYKNPSNGKTYYGAWTSYKSCLSPWVEGKSTSTSRGFTLTVKAAARVLNYSIYVSKSRDSGYVKTTTIVPTGSIGTNKTVRITKCGAQAMTNSTRYYVRILPVLNIGGKATNSALYCQGSIYVYNK